MKLIHKFVKSVPETLEQGVLYVSVEYATAIHKCCCGCGNEVVTPLSPKDWKLTFDGETVSLYPSIGNWNFGCRSHYWITKNRVEWARRRYVLANEQEHLEKKSVKKRRKSLLGRLFKSKG
jgi:Family of unknown function (DUF6527)